MAQTLLARPQSQTSHRNLPRCTRSIPKVLEYLHSPQTPLPKTPKTLNTLKSSCVVVELFPLKNSPSLHLTFLQEPPPLTTPSPTPPLLPTRLTSARSIGARTF